VVAEVADDVAVMYAGKIVERAPVQAMFAEPQHPYTVGLLGSIPRLDVAAGRGSPPSKARCPTPAAPAGCRFADRCPFAVAKCRPRKPPLMEVGAGHARPAGARRSIPMRWCRIAPSLRRLRMSVAPCEALKGLVKHFPVRRGLFGRVSGQVQAVDGVDLQLPPARRWAWSASRAAASRRWAGWCCA
jgi:oligopeptide/dipeptide ABC transporter ATP-binding protein